MLRLILNILLMLPNVFAQIPTSYQQSLEQPYNIVALNYAEPVNLLVLWRADCAGCREAMAEAEKAEADLKKYGLKVQGLYVGSWDSYFSKGRTQVPTKLVQLHDAGRRLSVRFNLLKVPTWVAVSEGGTILGKAETSIERQKLLRELQEHLVKKER